MPKKPEKGKNPKRDLEIFIPNITSEDIELHLIIYYGDALKVNNLKPYHDIIEENYTN